MISTHLTLIIDTGAKICEHKQRVTVAVLRDNTTVGDFYTVMERCDDCGEPLTVPRWGKYVS
jgi:rRNA maturation protein Nop10